MIAWDFLQKRLSDGCRRYSHSVARHPYPFILLPILLSCVLSIGWLYKNNISDAIYMYTPTNARSKAEQQAIVEAFPFTDGAYFPGRSVVWKRECSVVVWSRDRGNILRPDQSEAVIRLNHYIMNDIVIKSANGTNYTYNDLCLNGVLGCYTNPQVALIPQLIRNANPYMNLSYPTATYDKKKHYLGSTLGGVTIDPVSKQIVNAEAWVMVYQLNFQTPQMDALSAEWEIQFEKCLLHEYKDDLVGFSFYHSKTLDREIAKNGQMATPRLILMFVLLVAFAVSCTVTFDRKQKAKHSRCIATVNWRKSRPLVALAGVIGAAMGVASAIGFLSFFRLPYAALVTVMPFLVIAVRLDNTFLMIGALENTKKSLAPEERIAEAMAEAAVSITITVLTDVLSFACGVLTNFPSVQIFCIYTTLAILITFLYQLTFLLGILVLSARVEADGIGGLFTCRKKCLEEEIQGKNYIASQAPSKTVDHHCSSRLPLPAAPHLAPPVHMAVSNNPDEQSAISRWISNVYAPFLTRKPTEIAVVCFLLLFWAVSGYGCSHLRQGLEPVKLLPDNSYAVEMFSNMELYTWSYGTQMQVVFCSPGDITNEQNRLKIYEIVEAFTKCHHAIAGAEGVDFWLYEFERFLRRTERRPLSTLSKEEFYDKLDFFLSFNEYSRYGLDLAPPRKKTDNVTAAENLSTQEIKSFRLMVGLREFNSALNQQKAVDQFRALADSYPAYKVTVFHQLFPFVDQYEQILPNVLQEIYSSVACMIAIALLLIPHPICAIWVTLAIASIDLGVIGFMTLWGLNMDTVSMVTIIMSIGFSVDFTAHIAYAYVINMDKEPVDRIKLALSSLAWPVLQGGIATLIGVVVLADLNSYMIVAFFKTVFLVVIFGLLHALVFLPVLLSVSTDPRIMSFLSCKTIGNSRKCSASPNVSSVSSEAGTKDPTSLLSSLLRISRSCIGRLSRTAEVKTKTPISSVENGRPTLEKLQTPKVDGLEPVHLLNNKVITR